VFALFQDIAPFCFHNEYRPREPLATDYVYFYNKGRVLLENKDGNLSLPQYSTVFEAYPETTLELTYLLSVDETAVFLSMQEAEETANLSFQYMNVFREQKPSWLAFAGATAAHLALWYDARRFCGKCATPMVHKSDERAMVCPACGLIEYPKIAPVVIVAVTDGDRLLLTKYAAAASYNRYALIAGFVEIGESLEEGLKREVMEEVGLRVKNIRYYKSQPWAFSGSLLSGFFCELDGSDQVTVDTNELSEGVWFDRRSVPVSESTFALTATMMEAFRTGEI